MQSFDALGADRTDGEGGFSRAGGISLGSEVESFHSDEYEREVDRAVAAGRSGKGKGKGKAAADALHGDDAEDGDVVGQGRWAGLHGAKKPRLKSTVSSGGGAASRPGTALSSNPFARPDSRTTAGTSPNRSGGSGAVHGRALPSAVAAVGGGGGGGGGAPGAEGDSTLLRELNLHSLAGTSLNDSAAFAMSPPASPEVGRKGAGLLSGHKKAMLGRRSLGGDSLRGKGGHLTLREQEKVIDEVKKENFNLKLKIYFLEDRLAKLAPDQVDQALKENIEIKVEFQTVRQELKRYKRLLLEAERAIEALKSERDEAVSASQAAAHTRKPGKNLEPEMRRLRDDLDSERTAREQAEEQAAQAQLELKEVKEAWSAKKSHEWEGEDARVEIEHLQRELQEERNRREIAMGEQMDLKDELAEARDKLEEAQDKLVTSARREEARLRSSAGSRTMSRLDDDGDDDGGASRSAGIEDGSRRVRHKTERRLKDLESDNASLRSQVNAQVTMLSTRNLEKEDLQAEVENLKRVVLELGDELEHKDQDITRLKGVTRANQADESDVDALQEELNTYRDKLAAALLELENREKEIDSLNAELDEREAAFEHDLKAAREDGAGEADDLRVHRDDLQQGLDERDDQIAELSEKLNDLISMQDESNEKLHKYKVMIEDKEEELMAIAEELEATQADLKEIGASNHQLAAENDEKMQEIADLQAELDDMHREAQNRAAVHEEVVSKLKQKHASVRTELSELLIQHESTTKEAKTLRDQLEELALRHGESEERRRADAELTNQLEDQLADLERALREEKDDREAELAELRRERREQQAHWQQAVDAKQKALSAAEADLAQARGRLQAREDDLEKLQSALRNLETESHKLNESQSHDRFSLELEVERLQRDLGRVEEELEHAQNEAGTASAAGRTSRTKLQTALAEKDELADKLAALQRSRKELSDKYEEQSKALRQAQKDLAHARDRLQCTEDELASDHKRLSKTEAQYREQLTERNTLLLTAYQYLEKLIASGSSPRKAGVADAKPFTNFAVFHDSIIARLKALSAIQSGFDTRVKEVEGRLEKQYNNLKRAHDQRLRQLDHFESQIKTATEVQRQWKQRLATRQTELMAAHATSAELQKQIDSLKHRASMAGLEPGSVTEARRSQQKASLFEKKYIAAQDKLKEADTKTREYAGKMTSAQAAWEARMRELQRRNQELEEKVKREKQGAKERLRELEDQMSGLREQVASQERRGKQLDHVVKQVGTS